MMTVVKQQEGGNFTPHKLSSDDSEKYGGVIIKTFPKETDHGEIVEFLISSGLAETQKDNIQIKDNGSVTIRNLGSAECKILIENLHNKVKFGKKLYCNGIIPLTPPKNDDQNSGEEPGPQRSGSPLPPLSLPSPLLPPHLPKVISPSPSRQSLDIGPQSIIPETPDTIMQMANLDLLRRHSLSLRSPPRGSLADDILNNGLGSSNIQIQKVRSMMSDVKEALSDFDSCVSSPPTEPSSSESEAESSGTDKFKTVETAKPWQNKNNKRKKNTSLG